MLYSIIPPILIILSLIGIILFLMKKAPEAARREEQDKIIFSKPKPEDDLKTAPAENFGKIGDFKQKFTVVPQITSGAMKAGFSKLAGAGKVFSGVAKATKKKVNLDFGKAKKEPVDEKVWLEKFKRYDEKQEAESEPVEILSPGRKYPKPTISSEIIVPSRKAPIQRREREAFENILIERIAANPKDIVAYEQLGDYYIEIKSLKDAKECFKQVIKLDPKNRSVQMKMRRLERMLGR